MAREWANQRDVSGQSGRVTRNRIKRLCDGEREVSAKAAERGRIEKSKAEEGGELPNSHLPFRRTSTAGSMAVPHFHDRRLSP